MKKSPLVLLLITVSLYGAEQRFESQDVLFVGIGNAPAIQLPQLDSSQQLVSPNLFADTTVTTLDISHWPILDAFRLRRIAPLYPNLEELIAVYREEEAQQETLLTREFVQDLITFFPNLRSLTLINVTMRCVENAESILQNWQEAQPSRKLNLQINRKKPVPEPENCVGDGEREQELFLLLKNAYERLNSLYPESPNFGWFTRCDLD